MKANCKHYNQDFVNRMHQYPNLQAVEQRKINNCMNCKSSINSTNILRLGIHYEYMNSVIKHQLHLTSLMKSFLEKGGFVSMVFAEFNLIEDLQKSYDNIEFIYKDLFKRTRYENFNEFLKTLS